MEREAEYGTQFGNSLPELAAHVWCQYVLQDKDAECPSNNIPSVADITATMLADDSGDAWRECKERMLNLSGLSSNTPTTLQLWLVSRVLGSDNVVESETIPDDQILDMLQDTDGTPPVLGLRITDPIPYFCFLVWENDPQRWGQQCVDLCGFEFATMLDAVHAVWRKVRAARQKHGHGNKTQHPLVPFIELWQRAAKPDTRRSALFPSESIDPREAYTLSLPDVPTSPDMPLGPIPDTLYLAGLVPLGTTPGRPASLSLYDRSEGLSSQRGPGAPMALRVFVEAMTLLWQGERRGRRRVRLTLRDVRDWLYPNHPERYEAKRIVGPVRRALSQVDHLRVDAILPGAKTSTLWRPVSVTGYPRDSLDSPVIFDIELPPGSDVGALVDRHALRIAGVKSALKYRALLTLYIEWNRYGTHAGKCIQAKRPRVLRDRNGGLLDVRGNPIIDRRGRPESRWSKGVYVGADGKPTTAQGAVREWNPERKRYPIYTNDELLTLCYPLRDVTAMSRRRRLQDARRALEYLEKDGYLTLERDALRKDGAHGWRVMPPDGFGPMP